MLEIMPETGYEADCLVQGFTGSHAQNKGETKPTRYSPMSKKRKFEASESSDDESIHLKDTDAALLQHLVADPPSMQETGYGRNLDPLHVNTVPSKKRKLEGYSLSGSSLVDSVLKLDHPRKAAHTLPDKKLPSIPDDESLESPCPKAPTKKASKDTLAIVLRKLFFVVTPTEQMETSMRAYVSKTNSPFLHLPSWDCWLHPFPPQPSRHTGRSPGVISCHFSWKDTTDIYHSIGVNYGVVALLVKSRLTWTQKVGFIYNSWHLSHLCGNWTCCNWRHFTVEPGPINISRNACLLSSGLRTPKSDGKCKHQPPCMRKKKIKDLLKPSPATIDNTPRPDFLRTENPSRPVDRCPTPEIFTELVDVYRKAFPQRFRV